MRADRKPRGRTKTAPAAARRNLRPHGLAIAAIWIAILLAYSNSFSAGLIFDNTPIILRDPRITAVTGDNLYQIWRGEYWYTEAGNGLYRPLTTLSYLLNYAMLGNQDRPAGYHWVNFALHAINASLLYLLGLTIFRGVGGAFALALIWAVHPVLTESVTNVVGRADLLAGFGMLAALLCYRRGLEEGRSTRVWFAAASLACAVGMFSKESAVVIPLVAVVYDFCFPPSAPRSRRLKGYAALILPCLIYFAVRPPLYPLRIAFTDNPLIGAGFWDGRLTALKVIGKYILLLFFPLKLSSDYSYNAIPLFTWNDWQAYASLVACAAIALLAVWGWRRDRRWFFFIALAALALAPVANIAKLIGTIMAERFLYVPAMGFAGCLVLAGLALDRRFVPVAGVVLVVAFGVRTWARNSDWRDNRTMWASLVKAVPNSYKAHAFFYGKTLDDSVEHAGIALEIVRNLPDHRSTSVPYINAGKAYSEKGRTLARTAPAESAAWYRRSLAVLMRGKRVMEAAGEHRVELFEQLSATHSLLGEFTNAVNALETAQAINFAAARAMELASAYINQGDINGAEITLWKGLLADPGNPQISARLVDTYRKYNPGSCALQAQPGGWSINPSCPLVHSQVCEATVNLVSIFREQGRHTAAAELRRVAVAELGCPQGLF